MVFCVHGLTLAAQAKYARIHGESVATVRLRCRVSLLQPSDPVHAGRQGVKQRKLKAVLDQAEEADAAATAAARAEILLTEQAG